MTINQVSSDSSQNTTGINENFTRITTRTITGITTRFREVYIRRTPPLQGLDLERQKFYWNYQKDKKECPWDFSIFIFCLASFISLIICAVLNSYVSLFCACAFALTALIIYRIKKCQEFRPLGLIRYENSLIEGATE